MFIYENSFCFKYIYTYQAHKISYVQNSIVIVIVISALIKIYVITWWDAVTCEWAITYR